MVKKKYKIPEHKKDQLQGFEEFLDGIIDQGDLAYSSKLQDEKIDTFALYNFLEVEKVRVQKLKSMISRKIPNSIAHNQSSEVIDKLVTNNTELKDEIIQYIKSFDSNFHKQIREIYNDAYKN